MGVASTLNLEDWWGGVHKKTTGCQSKQGLTEQTGRRYQSADSNRKMGPVGSVPVEKGEGNLQEQVNDWKGEGSKKRNMSSTDKITEAMALSDGLSLGFSIGLGHL